MNGALFCPFCGASQIPKKERPQASKSRGNGQGTAYKQGNVWTASVVVGWRLPKDPSKPKIPVKRTKTNFATKKEALAYCSQMMLQGNARVRKTLEQVWNDWEPWYSPRVGASTMDGYRYAFKHFKTLHGTYIDMISAEDLQQCMDSCKSGKRTHENMKCTAGLLWKFAIDRNLIDRNVAENLFIGRHQSVQRDPLTPEEEEVIRQAIGKERYAEYVYCLCWLGFRPGEMLELRKDQLFFASVPQQDGTALDIWYFINGKKTEAGKDRIVIVPDQILPFILERIFIPGTDLVFPRYQFSKSRSQTFQSFRRMDDSYFRETVFKPMMARLHIAEGKVPYGARHTYADKLKYADGSDKDKASLMGHTKYGFTQSAYQSSHLADLKKLVESIPK